MRVFLCYSDTLLMYYCSNIENMEHKRGKEIFEEYKERLNNPDISEDERTYYSDIINAVENILMMFPYHCLQCLKPLKERNNRGNKSK